MVFVWSITDSAQDDSFEDRRSRSMSSRKGSRLAFEIVGMVVHVRERAFVVLDCRVRLAPCFVQHRGAHQPVDDTRGIRP